MKPNKELFYHKMKPYFDQGLVREIYNSDHLCILSLGEIYYIACPYKLLNDLPVGIYMNSNIMKKVVQKNRFIYAIMNDVFSDVKLNNDIIFDFPLNKIDVWKDWIKEARNKGISKINYQLEEEIQQMSKNKSR